jgi:hypothetical protein
MSWWIIPVKLETIETRFRADRRLAFQVLTAFGGKNQQTGPSRLLQEAEDGRRLVEFTSETGKHGKAVVTHEWVTVDEPGEIRFAGVKGPLQHLEDRFTLEDDNGCTQFRYESSIGVRGWWFGWLIARFYAKEIVERMMRTHVPEMKEAIENRASRSSLFPQTGCAAQLDQIADGALATSSA